MLSLLILFLCHSLHGLQQQGVLIEIDTPFKENIGTLQLQTSGLMA